MFLLHLNVHKRTLKCFNINKIVSNMWFNKTINNVNNPLSQLIVCIIFGKLQNDANF